MENVVLVIQRSEGGGLGIGGGGGGGVMSARGAATALSKITWGLAIAFLTTSIGLTIMSAQSDRDSSVIDATASAPAEDAAPADDTLPMPILDLDDAMAPTSADDSLAPPRVD